MCAAPLATRRRSQRGRRGALGSIRPPGVYFDPGHGFVDHCLYACLLCIAGQEVTLPNVTRLRSSLSLVLQRDQSLLTSHARRYKTSSVDYLARLESNGWGGLPEIELAAQLLHLRVRVVNGEGDLLLRVGAAPGAVLCWTGRHYM
eukprot:4893754-Amphidinium_carterae.1